MENALLNKLSEETWVGKEIVDGIIAALARNYLGRPLFLSPSSRSLFEMMIQFADEIGVIPSIYVSLS